MTTDHTENKKASNMANLAYRFLGIDPKQQYKKQPPPELEQWSRKWFTQTYVETEPTVGEWLRGLVPTQRGMVSYVEDLFPSAQWIPRYNMRWLWGDLIAGITVGMVVVPQAMAYALIAGLSPEHGLYTSFAGAALYWLFGTSRDIVIGTTAVGSLLVGTAIEHVEEARGDQYSRQDIAQTVSLLAGSVLLGVGLLKLGWIVDFIPSVPISAFVTAASVTIMSTQMPTALGITGINTREAPYHVIIHTLKNLGRTKVDAAIGLSAFVVLYFVKDLCARMERRQPSHKTLWSTLSSLRLTLAMILYTLISYLVNRHDHGATTPFRLVGHIEKGFHRAGIPHVNRDLAALVIPELPALVIVLVIEHVAIAKNFGRTFGYTVVPTQEIIAQGASNMMGVFLGGYCCTGSFGASAVLTKAGVRTPLAGLVSAVMLVMALYALTGVFFFIPSAALAGLILHAVYNLVTPMQTLYRFWQLSPLELFIWVVGVVVALFTSLEISIYVTICLSLALLLVRLARTGGKFLGQVRILHVGDDLRTGSSSVQPKDNKTVESEVTPCIPEGPSTSQNPSPRHHEDVTVPQEQPSPPLSSVRYSYLPLDRLDSSNPAIDVRAPYLGVFVYRFVEALNYLNQAHHVELMARYMTTHARRTTPDDGIAPSDRLWCDAGPTGTTEATETQNSIETKPLLRAVVLDCTAINNLDVASVQGLVDVRNLLAKFAAPETVEWHFGGLHNRWARRALAVAGFGFPSKDDAAALARWTPVYTATSSLVGSVCNEVATTESAVVTETDEEKAENIARQDTVRSSSSETLLQPIHAVDRPFFHIDLAEAVEAAVRGARAKDTWEHEVPGVVAE